MYETVVPPLEESDFEKTVAPIVQEYFEHGDTNEVAVSSADFLCADTDDGTISLHVEGSWFSERAGAAFGAEPGAHAERGAVPGRVTGPGGQSQPQGADFQAAGGPVWKRPVTQRHGKVL